MIRLVTKPLFAAMCLVLSAAPGLAQANCPCTTANQLTADQLASLLQGRMACAQVGSETWQEWHNGAGTAGGPVSDYKLGPGHPVDPSKVVGSYSITSRNNTVTYTYGSSKYTYAVCPQGASMLHAFCGSSFGGRDITDVKVGGSGLQSCSTVTPTRSAPRMAKPEPAPPTGPLSPGKK